MGVPLWQIDAFTDRPFRGNPAAVCLLPGPRPDDWMQDLAREMNLSETAFLEPEGESFRLRWFTPAVEVDLCGHATLASAHFLWEAGHLPPHAEARFMTRSGELGARRDSGWIFLDFPALPSSPVAAPAGMLEALGVTPTAVLSSRFDYLVEVSDEGTVRRARPDHGSLRGLGVRGVILTARADAGEADFVSRFFAPGAGIDEDPVTGSAHCCLAPYWSARLAKSRMLGYQASERGGWVRMDMHGDRVILGGQATTVLRGELSV